VPPKGKPGLHVAWTTVTYRSVFLAVLVVVLLVGLVSYLMFPEQSRRGMAKVAGFFGQLLEKLGGRANAGQTEGNTAHAAAFTMIDGTVRVKKANSNVWVNADYTLPLEKGDVVQTSAEGIAKIVFADGTSYNIKQDSLIVIEENTSNQQQTQVAVQLTTGTVDLATGTYSQGSRSQVIIAGATASLAPDSTATAHNDPRADQHEFLVRHGSADVARGNEMVKLTDYEKVSFQADSARMLKEKEIAPPVLIAPANMMPVFVPPGTSAEIQFDWTQIAHSRGYHMRVSRNPYFSSTVFDKKVAVSQVKVPGLGEGAYYWAVQSIDDKGKESVESEKNRFTVIAKGAENVELMLELDPFVQHGHVIEVRGRTEPNARVMVNGQEVPVIRSDGAFQFFTPPLPTGENVVTVTAQNTKGGVRTKQQKIVIQ
jgi:hypothetical protein